MLCVRKLVKPPVRPQDLIQPSVYTVTCSNTERFPHDKDGRHRWKLQLLQTSPCSRIQHRVSDNDGLPHGVALVGTRKEKRSSVHVPVLPAVFCSHTPWPPKPWNKAVYCSFARASSGLCSWCNILPREAGTHSGWEFWQNFRVAFILIVWDGFMSGAVSSLTVDMPRRRFSRCPEQSAHWWVVPLYVCVWSWCGAWLGWMWLGLKLVLDTWCTERPKLPNGDSTMNRILFEERTSELSWFSGHRDIWMVFTVTRHWQEVFFFLKCGCRSDLALSGEWTILANKSLKTLVVNVCDLTGCCPVKRHSWLWHATLQGFHAGWMCVGMFLQRYYLLVYVLFFLFVFVYWIFFFFVCERKCAKGVQVILLQA